MARCPRAAAWRNEAAAISHALWLEGWEELGRGSFAVSFARGNRVIKLVRIADNAAYLAFARHRRSRWDLHEGNILFCKESGVLRPVFSDPITY